MAQVIIPLIVQLGTRKLILLFFTQLLKHALPIQYKVTLLNICDDILNFRSKHIKLLRLNLHKHFFGRRTLMCVIHVRRTKLNQTK